MNVDTYEISFSYDEPNAVLNPLRNVIQQMLTQQHVRTARMMPLLNARMLLVIDTQQQRAEQVAQLLSSVGYRPSIALNALDAFTLFLQGTCVPFAILLGEEDLSTRFFLQRLLQQLKQRYDWNTPLIRLHNQQYTNNNEQSRRTGQFTGSFPQLPRTETLPPEQTARPSRALPALPAPTSTRPVLSTVSRHLPALPPPANATQPSVTRKPSTAKPQQMPAFPSLPSTPHLAVVSLQGHDIGRYHIEEQLSKSATYKTYDRLREQHIALKAIHAQNITQIGAYEAIEEFSFFQREKEVIDMLKHPHILPIANYGKSYISGIPFVYKTMPFCPEGSVADWLYGQITKELAPKDIVEFVTQLANALQHAHDYNILYLNFKLSNIMLRDQPRHTRQLQGLWTDFAVSSHEIGFTRTQGTYPYMAPECWNGQPLAVSDQYGFAAIIYELLTGRPPFQGNSERIMHHLHMNMPIQPPSTYNHNVTRALDNVLLRALAKKPEERFGSITHFLRAFQHYCGN